MQLFIESCQSPIDTSDCQLCCNIMTWLLPAMWCMRLCILLVWNAIKLQLKSDYTHVCCRSSWSYAGSRCRCI